jgi:hypothetical protein
MKMSDKETLGLISLSIPVVLAHPTLHEPRAFGAKGKETGEKKYSGNFVFEPDSADLKACKAIAVQVAKAEWPGRDLKELAWPFSNGTKLADARKAKGKDDGEFQRGKIVIAARSKYPPALSGIENGKLVEYDNDASRVASKSKFYFGVQCLAELHFKAYKGVGKNPDGVTCYLQQVLQTGKGDRLAKQGDAKSAFSGYLGNLSTVDPTEGGAAPDVGDEIPF